jgi:DNA-directed RNA polymerase III subunit RPC1
LTTLYKKKRIPSVYKQTEIKSTEVQFSSFLNKIREEAGKICIERLPHNNGLCVMSQCGAKGSSLNISQMIVCVGAHIING